MSTTELIFNNTKFYPMNENTDGSISFNGQNYAIGNIGSKLCLLQEQAEATKGKYDFYLALSTILMSGPTLTLNDLTNKGEKIRLEIIAVNNESDGSIDTNISVSHAVDLSKPDSNGHFNFSWDGLLSTHTYCWLSNGNFLITSDLLNQYAEFQAFFMEIFYSDAS